ncbi:MAG TPA: hypothetical protein PKM63_06055 [Panacibacter sp.]|nr:hypothetical protein [Panacibacter sp.]HNP43829.1 hypothetical protein [Panacibacter sp.]
MKLKPLNPENNNSIIFGNSHSGLHYWIGLLSNGHDYFIGQSFRSPATGRLRSICILPELILENITARLSVFHFDRERSQCREKLAETVLTLQTCDAKSWASFNSLDLELERDKDYCFKIDCNDGKMMAVAECAWNNAPGCSDGAEWVGHSANTDGHFFAGFGLTFLAEIRAN